MAITAGKGDSVFMYAFTGMPIGKFEITEATKKTVSILLKNGNTGIFDRKTGKQTNASKDQYANSITEDAKEFKKAVKAMEKRKAENAAKREEAAKAKVKTEKKSKAKAKKAEDEDIDEDEYEDADDEEDEDETPAPKKSKAKAKAKPAAKSKKSKKVVEEDEDDDDLDDEDDEDDD